jgi:type II secretory pathway pseudopilin PulG
MTKNARRLLTSVRGFTVAEMAVMLTVTGLAAGALAPAVQDQIAEARFTRALNDTHAIATAVSRFEGDVLGQSNKERGWATFDVLVGAGAAPTVGTGGDAAWVADLGSAGVGSLDDQLVTNAVGYKSLPQRQSNPIRGWHGPYLETGIASDPWGNRYAINVKALSSGASCTVVVSAGPNGKIETAFNGVVILPGGDDLVALVAPPR